MAEDVIVTDTPQTTPEAVVIIPKAEYDRLVSASMAMPDMEQVKRFRALGATWAVRSINRRAAIDEWEELEIIASNPRRGFKNHGGDDWE
jgi:hypothetical protein